jgi:hypothetical protein
VRAFDVALTLHADHELNASTFAGRVAAARSPTSTRPSSRDRTLKVLCTAAPTPK